MLRQVTVIRYVTPLREGGSLPGVVEADAEMAPRVTPELLTLVR
ncbi:hypothetical protein AB0J84_20690 [Micromonospora arborensis]